jgi:hypothetical protein
MIRVVHPGSRIRMLTFSHPGSRIQGSKRHPIPDPGSATLKKSLLFFTSGFTVVSAEVFMEEGLNEELRDSVECCLFSCGAAYTAGLLA